MQVTTIVLIPGHQGNRLKILVRDALAEMDLIVLCKLQVFVVLPDV